MCTCTEVMTDDCFRLVFARCLLGGRKDMSYKRHFAVIHKSSMSEQQEKKNEKRSNRRTQAYVKMAVKTLCASFAVRSAVLTSSWAHTITTL